MMNTPSGRFLPMWFAIFASVFVGAKPTPQGMPTHRQIFRRSPLPYAERSSTPLGGWMNASSMEYCSTSTASSRSTETTRRERSP